MRELLGPVDVDQLTVTGLLGAALGHPALTYVRMDDDAMVAALVDAGFAEGVARQHTAMTAAINELRIRPTQPRTPERAMPTTYVEYAQGLVRT